MLSDRATVSVVIANFNYAAFLSDAVNSALALDWPKVQVIVVDDGSTDNSRAIIDSYGDRIQASFQCNRGNAAAYERGWQIARGEVIMLLDADDVLDQTIIRALAPAWTPRVAKVQFQMRIVDAALRPLGSVIPQYLTVPTAAQIRQWFLACGAYPTPPGSGNAYARWFLEAVGPFDLSLDRAADSLLLPLAPLYGDVVTVPEILVSYRVHGQNLGAQRVFDPAKPGIELRRTQARWRYAREHAKRLFLDCADDALARNLQALEYRAGSLVGCPERHPIEDDRRIRIIGDAFRALSLGQGRSASARLAALAWITLVCLAPRRLVIRLLSWRFVPHSRPASLQRLLRVAGAIR